MVVPVLRNLGILAPWLSRKAFLRQRSKEKPPFGGRSIAVFVISSALSLSTHEMAIKGKKQEMVMARCAHKYTRQTKPGIRVRRVSEQAQAWIGTRLIITEVKRPYNRPIRFPAPSALTPNPFWDTAGVSAGQGSRKKCLFMGDSKVHTSYPRWFICGFKGQLICH